MLFQQVAAYIDSVPNSNRTNFVAFQLHHHVANSTTNQRAVFYLPLDRALIDNLAEKRNAVCFRFRHTPDNGAHFALSALIWASKARRPWDPHNHVLASLLNFASLLCFRECLIAISCIFFDPEKFLYFKCPLLLCGMEGPK